MPTCHPGSLAQFDYCPSLPASILFALLFGCTTTLHIVQAARYHASFCWILIMSGTWQTMAYIIRCYSITRPLLNAVYDTQYVLVMLAPLWTNAFCFMLLGRLVHFFTPSRSIMKIQGQNLGAMFVTLDIASFIIQLAGALFAISRNVATSKSGFHIYTAGVALQQFFILCFIVLATVFHRPLKANRNVQSAKSGERLLYTMYAALFLISFRIIYRIIEFSAGLGSKITSTIEHHEYFPYCFDTLPMFIAIVLFHICHPGEVLQGPNSKFPTRKEKKELKRQMNLIAEGREEYPMLERNTYNPELR